MGDADNMTALVFSIVVTIVIVTILVNRFHIMPMYGKGEASAVRSYVMELILLSALGIGVGTLVLCIAELRGGEFSIRFAFGTLVAVFFMCQFKYYHDILKFDSSVLAKFGRGLEHVWKDVLSGKTSTLWHEFNRRPVSFLYAFLIAFFDLIFVASVYNIQDKITTMSCPVEGDSSNRTTRTCSVGFSDQDPFGTIEFDDELSPEAKLVSAFALVFLFGGYSVYYAFYVRLLFTSKVEANNVEALDRKNRHQENLLDLKQNDIKLLASSWRLMEKDIRCEEKIGEGGYSTMYRGTLHNNWQVAIKFLRNRSRTEDESIPKQSGVSRLDMQHLESNSKEIQFLMRTRHSRLVMFVGFGACSWNGGGIFVVLEYMPGGDLSTRLWNPDKPPAWTQRIVWLEDVSEGLSFLHYAAKAVHRDVKSPNVLLTGGDPCRAKLGDFGLTKFVRRGKRRVRKKSNSLRPLSTMKTTQGDLSPMHSQLSGESTASKDSERFDTDVIIDDVTMAMKCPERESPRRRDDALWVKHLTSWCGTCNWMAPEMFGEDRFCTYGPQVDVYAFGCLMYEMLALQQPWSNMSRQKIVSAVRRGERPFISDSMLEEAPAGYVDLLERCWAQSYETRPSIGEVSTILKHDIIVTSNISTNKSILESRRQSVLSTRSARRRSTGDSVFGISETKAHNHRRGSSRASEPMAAAVAIEMDTY